jgi:hypothetical protein
MWARLHRVTSAAEAYSILQGVPCGDCAAETLKYLADHPIPEDPREWAWEFHNHVNRRLGKVEMAREEFDRLSGG